MKTLHRCTQALFAALLSMGLLFVVAGTASAHAKVLSATPAIGSTIAKAPTTVTVVCAENINPNPKLSNLFVYAPSGDLISQGDAKVSLSNPKEMSIGIKASDNGVYVVRWITVSADDGDPDQGAFVFTVKPTVAATGNTNTTELDNGEQWNAPVGNDTDWSCGLSGWFRRRAGYWPQQGEAGCCIYNRCNA